MNGFPCASYAIPEPDGVSVAFVNEEGYALEVTCVPASEEGAELVWGVDRLDPGR